MKLTVEIDVPDDHEDVRIFADDPERAARERLVGPGEVVRAGWGDNGLPYVDRVDPRNGVTYRTARPVPHDEHIDIIVD